MHLFLVTEFMFNQSHHIATYSKEKPSILQENIEQLTTGTNGCQFIVYKKCVLLLLLGCTLGSLVLFRTVNKL